VVFEEGDLAEPWKMENRSISMIIIAAARPLIRAFLSVIDRLSVLVNCIYWDERYPRLLTRDQCRRMWAPGRRPKLMVIGDISCDVNGSIECTVKATEPGNPVYVYDPATGTAKDGFEARVPS
jgi:alpha-aminoadipic semialdehyde synthase